MLSSGQAKSQRCPAAAPHGITQDTDCRMMLAQLHRAIEKGIIDQDNLERLIEAVEKRDPGR